MTGKELWAQYQHHTRDLTEHGRKLGFAAAAICWVFRIREFSFPPAIQFSLLLLVCYFLSDILHSFLGAVRIKRFVENKEKELWNSTGSIEGEIDVPLDLDKVAFCLFVTKVAFLVSTFVAIGVEIVWRMRATGI